MDKLIIAIVVIVAILAHIALYRWVKFKIHEGVILQFLRDAAESGIPDHHHAESIAQHTNLTAERVTAVCTRSREIHADANVSDSWRAN